MKIKVFKQFTYKGYPVIIRKLGKWVFEYLLLYKGKFYGTFIIDKLKWWQFYKIFFDNPHSKEEEISMINFLTKVAETTIETLNKEKSKPKNNGGKDSQKNN